MFSNVVIDSDRFLDLSPMAQLLYFHCGMKTDDDGFVGGARRIARIIGATEQDFKALTKMGLLIEFPDSKVFVISHHRQNNDLKNDRYHPTDYQREFALLEITENKEYRLKQTAPNEDTDCNQCVSNTETNCNQLVSNMSTEPSLANRNPSEPIVTNESRGKRSDEGKTDAIQRSVIESCIQSGIDEKTARVLLEKYGAEILIEAFPKWFISGEGIDRIESFIEKCQC